MAKERIREAVRKQCESTSHLFCGEVYVEIEWLVNERLRWDSPGVLKTPDIDNIVKPLIDGLCGQRGVLIDDCQVQSLACSWIDWLSLEHRITVTVRPLHPDDVVRRRIVGVERDDGFCWIVPEDLPPAGAVLMVSSLNRLRDHYEDLLAAGIPEHDARYIHPIAKRFHRSQVARHGFAVVTSDAYEADMRARAAE